MKPGYISIYSLRSGLYKMREASQRTGLTPRAIRHYEALGLLPPTKRSRGKIRLYTEADCVRLAEIKKLRLTGKSLPEITAQLSPLPQKDIVIFVDSAFSVSVAAAEQYGVRIIPDTLHFGTTTYQDYTTLAPEAFVGVAKRKRAVAVSEPPTVEDYVALFSGAVADGYRQIVSLHPDQRLSRSYERALSAAKALPQLEIHVMDTQLMSLGAHYLFEQLTANRSVPKIQKLIAACRTEITEFIILGSLKHLAAAQNPLDEMLLSYVPILQHTAKDGLLPIARLETIAAAGKYLHQHARGFSQYRVGYSTPEGYAALRPHIKNLPVTTAQHYSSVLMANYGDSLVGVAALR